jgi:hypothetical protein
MNRAVSRVTLAIVVLAAIPLVASAQRHGGGGGGGRPRSAPAPMARPAAPPAAPARPAAPPAGNFNFSHDIAPQRPVAPAQPKRPEPVAQRAHVTQRAPTTSAATGGAFRGHFNGHRIENNHWHGNWAWNHGAPWNPAPIYWGGGFWGDFAIASLGGLGTYGYIEDTQDGYEYDSYQVQPDTPGADLLADYDLQQVECGPPGLVDIWGPDGSVICANPNDEVAPGDYEVDPETFTLVPAT